MVVVPFGIGVNRDQLWAHEFGHTRGLFHRNGAGLVMNEQINGGTNINTAERDAYINPVIAFFSAFSPAEEAGDPNVTLQEFVSYTFAHGIPYERAASYGAAAVPELIRILKDPAQESRWSTAATMLAIIGEPAGVDAVIEFIREPGAGDLTAERSWARGNAVLSLGYSANKGNGKALKYLQDGLDPGAWKQQGLRGLRSRNADPEVADEESDDELLSERAAFGLALSGRSEARAALEVRLRAPGRTARQQEALQAALSEHAKVASKGLKGYDLERRARVVSRAEAAKGSQKP